MAAAENLTLTPSFWGSVNTWECDENDHQNVRFFAHKINQALQAWAADRAGDPAMTARVLPSITSQHIRFLREARAAAPVRVECGQIAHAGDRLTVVAVMRHNATNEPLAAFQTVLDTRDWPASWPKAPAGETPGSEAPGGETPSPETSGRESPGRQTPGIEAPEYARPRGLDPATLPAPPVSRAAALASGFHIVGRGVIGGEECGPDGTLLPHAYIGRVSDGMPNLWVFLSGSADLAGREEGVMGGAALEYHLRIHEPLRQGDVYTHLAGVRALAAKTQTMAHVVINERTGRCAANASAIGVGMDLRTRKAVAIPPERRARLEQLLLKE